MLTNKVSKTGAGKRTLYFVLLAAFCLAAVGCRYDMQDQPRYKAYKKSDFFKDGRARGSPDAVPAAAQCGQPLQPKIATPNRMPPLRRRPDSRGNTLVVEFSERYPRSVPLTKTDGPGQARFNITASFATAGGKEMGWYCAAVPAATDLSRRPPEKRSGRTFL